MSCLGSQSRVGESTMNEIPTVKGQESGGKKKQENSHWRIHFPLEPFHLCLRLRDLPWGLCLRQPSRTFSSGRKGRGKWNEDSKAMGKGEALLWKHFLTLEGDDLWSLPGVSFGPLVPGCCSVAQSCPPLCDPWTAAHQASLSFTTSQSLLKL